MAVSYKGKLPFGNPEAVEVSKRIAGVFATTAALQGLAPTARVDGMIAVVSPASLWVFNAASAAGASATVLVPTVGTGRWLAAVIPA